MWLQVGWCDLSSNRHVVDEVDVPDAHFASRSSSSRSSSMIRRTRDLNSGSLRRRSTASLSACLTVSLRLLPSARQRLGIRRQFVVEPHGQVLCHGTMVARWHHVLTLKRGSLSRVGATHRLR